MCDDLYINPYSTSGLPIQELLIGISLHPRDIF
jgi:hypothetical protein